VALLTALLLAGCGTPERIVLQPPPGAPAGVDGRYRGTVRLVRAGIASCSKSNPRVLQVTDGIISLGYTSAPRQRATLTTTIQGDGGIHANDGVGTMEGQAKDGQLELTIASSLCEHRWTMTRVN